MKNSRHILSMSILAAFLLSSCDTQRITPEEPVETVTPVLVSDTDGDISFPAAGGQGTIGYGIENPVENENISVSIHDGGEWIRNIDSSVPGVISYEVLANEGAERQTVLILSYAEAQPLAFNIRQNAAGSDPQFVFNEDSVREYAVVVEVNVNTAMRAYEYLQGKEVIYNKRGIGYFVCPDAKSKILLLRRKQFLKDELPEMFRQITLLNIPMSEIVSLYEHYQTSECR